ncbi:SDR family oxidoreductase [Chloroflexales bacterium ZM16-3]|nr:SDR family oxidoreductase [Chloroflexales bacterium ZM16-3]
MTLSGKVAVVTGGTGALGAAVARSLLDAGAAVVVTHRAEGELSDLRARLGIADDAPLSGMLVDLTDEAAVKSAYGEVAASHGGIDILVNAAGGFGGGAPVHQSGWAIWQQQLDINLKTAVISCASGVPHMIARGGGAIVNVGTRTATQPGANLAAYAASKRAVLQLTEALAAELRGHNITANAVLPSTIDTPANRKGMPNGSYDDWVKPEEIAAVVRFLVGPEGRIISGASIPVYGRA